MLKKVEHLSLEERTALGEAARDRVPPSSHAGWTPTPDRRSPVDLIEEQDARRDADLVPVRHGRMMASPFTFYRGAAKIMAADLQGTPTAGFEVQLCGDAHLSNFGVFGSPERRLVFDINDFDDTCVLAHTDVTANGASRRARTISTAAKTDRQRCLVVGATC